MTTPPDRPGQEGTTSAPTTGLPPPAERGATVIPDKVVTRIAAKAARTSQARRAAVPVHQNQPARPRVTAAVRDGSVRLHLDMDLPYPADIAGVCQQIQRDVAERVSQLTGLRVREVALTVRRLVTGADTARPRVR
ncbi:Asp23/Gls24 family envelope stress response protein [Streptomyces sp. NPDC005727]|uniref:Asp23/Gls24 family envelope stress response protein n=1 Tax=Streptomyces sp. NPDC005727 TaxID=3157053 RepID=UPI0033D60143